MLKSVLIADDQEVIRHMLGLMFASQDDFEVCGEAENGQEAVEMAQILRYVSRRLHKHALFLRP